MRIGLMLACVHGRAAAAVTGPNAFDTVIGTQTFGPSYQFTREPKLVETATAIAAMGSPIIKFALSPEDPGAGAQTLVEIAQRDPAVRTVLDMPFAFQLMWAQPMATKSRLFEPDTLDIEYRQLYDLTRYLLTTYAGSGKTFYLGNWEGDWLLTRDGKREPSEQDIAAVSAWVDIRQKAVDDAKRVSSHAGVQVYYYVEVNRVVDAQQGKLRIANAVLPRTNVDFVSYSSYDSLFPSPEPHLAEALDYLQSKLQPKPSIVGKRVFIGEFGFPADKYSPQQQDDLSRRVMKIGLRWGCPFVLYWEIYNNEVNKNGQRGFWLIDDHGIRQPIYHTIENYYASSRRFLREYGAAHRHLPTEAEFDQWAVSSLK